MMEIKLHLLSRSRARTYIVLVQVIGQQCWPQVSLHHWNVAQTTCTADNLLLHLVKIPTAQNKHLQMFILEISPCGVGEEKKCYSPDRRSAESQCITSWYKSSCDFFNTSNTLSLQLQKLTQGEKKILKLFSSWNVLPQTWTFLQCTIRLHDKFILIVKLVKFISEISDFLHTSERK